MSNKQCRKESKISRCMKAPIRVLMKARDFYIRSLTDCSGMVGYGGVMGGPNPQITTLPKSFSVNSTVSSGADEDLRELIRLASTRSLGNKIEAELLRQQRLQTASPMTGPNVVPRSQSVAIGIGRIDEDKPSDFDQNIMVKTDVYPRSRSYAVGNRFGNVGMH